MAQPIDYFHKRLAGIEKTLERVLGLLDKLDRIQGGMDLRFDKIEKTQAATEHRVRKLEKANVAVDATVARYIEKRLARDKQLRRDTDVVSYELRDVQERLNHIELAAFPNVAGEIAKVIGAGKAGNVAKANALDRRKSKPRR